METIVRGGRIGAAIAVIAQPAIPSSGVTIARGAEVGAAVAAIARSRG